MKGGSSVLDQLPIRLSSKIAPDHISGCWIWTASLREGYGQFRVGSSVRAAHVVVFEYLVGPVAEGHELDHLCRDRRCVNPVHLEQVTHRVNVLRGVGVTAVNAVKTNCPQGHPLVLRSDGHRSCRPCGAEARARANAKAREFVANWRRRPSTEVV